MDRKKKRDRNNTTEMNDDGLITNVKGKFQRCVCVWIQSILDYDSRQVICEKARL